MANQDTYRKIITLAIRAKGSTTTLSEDNVIRAKLEATRPTTRQQVRKILAEAVNTSETSVLIKFAAHDDSDRLIDEIITGLQK